MPTTVFNIGQSDNDGTIGLGANTNGAVARAFNDGEESSEGFLHFDTAGIPDEQTVQEATLRLYHDAFDASSGVNFSHAVEILNADQTQRFTVFFDTESATGFEDIPVPAALLQHISKTGLTRFRLTVPNPGAGAFRRWDVRTYDYDVGHSFQATLTVTHNKVINTSFSTKNSQ